MFCLVISWFTSFPGLLVLAVVVGLVGAVLLYVVDMLYFLILPRWAIKKYGKTNIERLRRILERMVATPSFIGTQQKLSARVALVGIYVSRGQHVEAAAHCRANLASLAEASAWPTSPRSRPIPAAGWPIASRPWVGQTKPKTNGAAPANVSIAHLPKRSRT